MADTWIVTIPLRWRGEAGSRVDAVNAALMEILKDTSWALERGLEEAVAVDMTPPWGAAAMGD